MSDRPSGSRRGVGLERLDTSVNLTSPILLLAAQVREVNLMSPTLLYVLQVLQTWGALESV